MTITTLEKDNQPQKASPLFCALVPEDLSPLPNPWLHDGHNCPLDSEYQGHQRQSGRHGLIDNAISLQKQALRVLHRQGILNVFSARLVIGRATSEWCYLFGNSVATNRCTLIDAMCLSISLGRRLIAGSLILMYGYLCVGCRQVGSWRCLSGLFDQGSSIGKTRN